MTRTVHCDWNTLKCLVLSSVSFPGDSPIGHAIRDWWWFLEAVQHRSIFPLTQAVSGLRGLLSETGSRNKWLLVTFNRARVEQVTCLLQFINTSRILLLARLIFTHWLKPFRVGGVGSRKPEVEISDCWWRLIELGWNNSSMCCNLLTRLAFYFQRGWYFPIDSSRFGFAGSEPRP